jgi:hypothetical protein
VSARVEAAGQGWATRNGCRLAGKVAENGLGNVLRQVNVNVDLQQDRGIDQIEVPPNQFGKRVFRPSLGIAAKQITIARHSKAEDGSRRRLASGINRTLKAGEFHIKTRRFDWPAFLRALGNWGKTRG